MASSIYADDTYWVQNSTFHEEDSAFKAACCIRLLSAHAADPVTVLDVGCGGGKFLATMATANPDGEYLGVDVSPEAVRHADQAYASRILRFEHRPADSVLETFDLVTMTDVFEHVDDYIGFLRAARRLGRSFYFNIPLDMNVQGLLRNLYMHERRTVGHLHYFSKPSALATLDYAGYDVIGWQYNSTDAHRAKVHRSWKAALASVPRAIVSRISPDWSVSVLGGASLGVLCRPKLDREMQSSSASS